MIDVLNRKLAAEVRPSLTYIQPNATDSSDLFFSKRTQEPIHLGSISRLFTRTQDRLSREDGHVDRLRLVGSETDILGGILRFSDDGFSSRFRDEAHKTCWAIVGTRDT